MAYRVEMTARARRDLDAIYTYIHAGSAEAAHRWFNELERVILNLEHHPERGSITRENSRLRQLLYGRKSRVYRIIYSVHPRKCHVQVLHIRHGAMRDAVGIPMITSGPDAGG